MLARFAFGVLLAGTFCTSASLSAMAEPMNAEQARKFVAGKLFSFNCFDGTRGVGRVYDDGSAAGSVQFSGGSQVHHVRLPSNTLQVRSGSICASIKGLPFDPCFSLNKSDEVSFRGAIAGLGFAYCDFRRQGNARTFLARTNKRPRSLHPPGVSRSAEASHSEVAQAAPRRSEAVPELRKSRTD